jgi:hypothetical protein
VQEVACRRRILARLVAWWLPDKARVAEVLLVGWNQEHRANELVTELIEGRGVSLHHPFSADREWEYRDLLDNVMTPLQRKLDEAGFDGLLWQAGYRAHRWRSAGHRKLGLSIATALRGRGERGRDRQVRGL